MSYLKSAQIIKNQNLPVSKEILAAPAMGRPSLKHSSKPFVETNLGQLGYYLALSSYAFAISFLWGGFLSLILPVLNTAFAPQFFGTGSTELVRGILAGVGLGLAMLMQPLSGTLSDHFQHPLGRRRPFIIAGTIGVVSALALIVITSNWWILAGGYLLLQFSANLSQGAYQGLQPDVVAPPKRSQAAAAFTLAQMTGTLAGALTPGFLQTWLGGLAGSRISLIITGLLIILATLLTCGFIKEKPFHQTLKKPLWQTSFTMFSGLKQYSDFSWLMLQRFFFLAASASLGLFIKPFLENTGFIQPVLVNGQSEINAGATASFLLGVVGVTAAAGAYLAVRFSRRLSRKAILYWAAGVGLVGALLIQIPYQLMAQAGHSINPQLQLEQLRPLAFGLVAICSGLIGVSVGAFSTVSWAFANEVIPSQEAGRFMGLSNFATAGSSALAGIADGWILTSTWGYGGLFGLVALYFLLSWLLLGRVKAKGVNK